MDALDLARLQFALTGSLHFLFVVLTLGLAPLVAIMNTRWARTGRPLFERMTRFWGQIYVINYALGIVTGLVMEFQFGLSWSGLSHYAGDVFGAPLAMETLVAFFLESTFLGLWIFGWGRLPKWAHVACIWAVTATAYASAFFIMVANSFLQNPAGAVDAGDRLALVDAGALFTNKTLVFALPHVLGAGLFTGAMVLVGASAYQLRRRTHEQEFFTRSMKTGIVAAAVGITLTVAYGYAQFGGIQDGKFDDNPAAAVPLGLMMEGGNLLSMVVLLFMLPLIRKLPRWRWAHPLLMALTPVPFVLAILGWLARELGRQPWMIWEKLTVADAMTPGLTTGMVTASLTGFVAVLGLLAVVDYVLIARVVRRGPRDLALGATATEQRSPALSH
ncbi:MULTISPECIES: cytochrome ubiquinol oxidase subunit I [Nonomuraea]|uniref:Cytochrome ubiquinol oxidase subunit I n=1 Tax=Nonomuraea ferruginea TaxID=46174 RepID=A0ABT4TBQ6_9ACTN|nr:MULTISPECIES: cytochrome ubiquinol oxidase subunit I [Nonomuraea]MDA0646870.1 cytochrome ubiquinol oxidase subunit I [Nonomuraea ferruginea]TXK41663.1 cytochrome ubiquinol oxidase subunit I [Nonomuraea sp. C10]